MLVIYIKYFSALLRHLGPNLRLSKATLQKQKATKSLMSEVCCDHTFFKPPPQTFETNHHLKRALWDHLRAHRDPPNTHNMVNASHFNTVSRKKKFLSMQQFHILHEAVRIQTNNQTKRTWLRLHLFLFMMFENISPTRGSERRPP